jgi:hypothetical protein
MLCMGECIELRKIFIVWYHRYITDFLLPTFLQPSILLLRRPRIHPFSQYLSSHLRSSRSQFLRSNLLPLVICPNVLFPCLLFFFFHDDPNLMKGQLVSMEKRRK